MGEEELGAELVGEEELDEVEGLKVAVGGVKLLTKAHPPYRKAEVRVVVVVLVAVVLVVRSASSSSSSSSSTSSSFMGRGLGLKPNLTLTLTLRPEHSPTYPHVPYTFSGPNRRMSPTPTY